MDGQNALKLLFKRVIFALVSSFPAISLGQLADARNPEQAVVISGLSDLAPVLQTPAWEFVLEHAIHRSARKLLTGNMLCDSNRCSNANLANFTIFGVERTVLRRPAAYLAAGNKSSPSLLSLPKQIAFVPLPRQEGWTVSDFRSPRLPSGKDRGFGLGYSAGLEWALFKNWTCAAAWERHRYEVVNEKSNVDYYFLALSYRY